MGRIGWHDYVFRRVYADRCWNCSHYSNFISGFHEIRYCIHSRWEIEFRSDGRVDMDERK